MTDYSGLIEGVGSALFSVLGLTKTFQFVKEGELGIKLRFGKAKRDQNGEPQVIPPGFVMMIPWVDTLEKHHVRQQTIRFDNQKIMIRDGLIFNVNAAVIFRVIDIYRALFEIDDLNTSIADLSMGILRDVFTGRDHTNLNQTKEISALLLEELREKARQWGVDFLQFNIIDCAPAPETAQIIVAKAGVAMKAEALEEMARKRGIRLDQFNPTLAAVLVGVPLVASISPEPNHGEKNNRTATALAQEIQIEKTDRFVRLLRGVLLRPGTGSGLAGVLHRAAHPQCQPYECSRYHRRRNSTHSGDRARVRSA